MKRLFTLLGLCLAVALAAGVSTPTSAQEKKPKAAAATQDRIDGTVKAIDAKTKTISVRVRGKTMSRDVIYDEGTKFTYRNKPASFADVKDERRVICLGKLNEKGQLTATRIDVRDKM